MRDRRHFFNETHAYSNWHATYHHNHYHNLHHEDHNHRHYGRHALLYPPTPEPGNGAFRSHDTGATSTDQTDNSKRHAQDGSQSTSYIDILHEDAKVSLVSRFELRLASAIALVNKELQRVAGVAMPIIIRRMHDDTMRGIMIEWLEAPADTHAMYQLVKYIAGRDKIRLRRIILSYYLNPDIVNPDIVNPENTNPVVVDPVVMDPEIADLDIADPEIADPEFTDPIIINNIIEDFDIADPVADHDIADPEFADPVKDMIQNLKEFTVVNHSVDNQNKLNFLVYSLFNHNQTLNMEELQMQPVRTLWIHRLLLNEHRNNKQKATPSLYALILKRLMSRDMFNKISIQLSTTAEIFASIKLDEDEKEIITLLRHHPQEISIHFQVPIEDANHYIHMAPPHFPGFVIDKLRSHITYTNIGIPQTRFVWYVKLITETRYFWYNETMYESILRESAAQMTKEEMVEIIREWVYSTYDTNSMCFLVQHIPDHNMHILREAINELWMHKVKENAVHITEDERDEDTDEGGIHESNINVQEVIEERFVQLRQIEIKNDVLSNKEAKLNFLLCTLMNIHNEAGMDVERRLVLTRTEHAPTINQDTEHAPTINQDTEHASTMNQYKPLTLYVLILSRLIPLDVFGKLIINIITTEDQFSSIVKTENEQEVMKLMREHVQEIHISFAVDADVSNEVLVEKEPKFNGFQVDSYKRVPDRNLNNKVTVTVKYVQSKKQPALQRYMTRSKLRNNTFFLE